MGEVYRADDLEARPAGRAQVPAGGRRRDPARLTQLHSEVRMARQVSHPNVCRVYDVGEHEGHTFLSMEYVDGEDLASLIRRIGRFPQDRAIELARQICAGPRRGARPRRRPSRSRSRRTSCSTAAAGSASPTSALPARRAKRCAQARPPTWRPSNSRAARSPRAATSTALGLVLYEMFTGRRALEGRNLAELIAKREQEGITRAIADRARSRSVDRSRDHALRRARSGAASGVRARRGRGAAGRRSARRRAGRRRNAVAGDGRRRRHDQRA